MTSLEIVRAVADLSGAASEHTPTSVMLLDPELDKALSSLRCADKLRADLPVLFHNQLASLIVKCWTYLVWIHLIENDPARMTRVDRDQVLWSLMRPFEMSHATQPNITDDNNTHAKTKIKMGLKLTALLLCNEQLLVKFVTLGNISADVTAQLALEHQLHSVSILPPQRHHPC